jgi:1-acyl-sn-glycerol-3-phosphate acyltransferase
MPTGGDPRESDEIDRRRRGSRRFWKGADPRFLKTLERHNTRIGSPLQRVLSRAFMIFALGPAVFVLVHTVFRIRVVGREHLDKTTERAILAWQHFFEWDPLLTSGIALWARAIARPRWQTYCLGGHFWMKSRPRRLVSWLFGLIGVQRGVGMEQGGLRRASEILSGPAARSVAIYPTGPIGRSVDYEVRPGVAYLSLACPDVPVIPAAVLGVRELRWRDVLMLRRPEIHLVFGEPFRGRDLPGTPCERRVQDICQRIEDHWRDAASAVESSSLATSRQQGAVGIEVTRGKMR